MAVVGACSTAAGAYFWKIGWGLEHGLLFADEIAVWVPKLRGFIPLTVDSFFFERLQYPPLFAYLAGLATAAAVAVGWVGDPRLDPSGALLVARSVGAAFALLAVVVTGVCGRFAYSARTGIVALALMAVVPLLAVQVHYANVYGLFLAMVALVLLTASTLARRGNPTSALAAGAAAGLAVAANYSGLAFLAAPAWAALECARRARSVGLFLRLAAMVGLGFLLSLLVSCPPWFVEPEVLLQEIETILGRTRMGFGLSRLTTDIGWYGRPYLYQLVASFPYTLGLPLYCLVVAGVVASLRRFERADRVVLAALVPYFIVIGYSGTAFPRYLLPLVPGLVLLAARFLDGLERPRWRAVLLALTLAYGALFTFTQVARFSYEQHYELATWMADRVKTTSSHPQPVLVLASRVRLRYSNLVRPMRAAGLAPVSVVRRPGSMETEFVVLPHLSTLRKPTMPHEFVIARFVEQLESGAGPYREVARWESTYFQRDFYRWLDPSFGGMMGETGFTVYQRDTLPKADQERGLGTLPRPRRPSVPIS